MLFWCLTFVLFLVLAVLAAIAGCDHRGRSDARQAPPTNTSWQGEDTGYQSNESAARPSSAPPPTQER
jgi:hypothetical protein